MTDIEGLETQTKDLLAEVKALPGAIGQSIREAIRGAKTEAPKPLDEETADRAEFVTRKSGAVSLRYKLLMEQPTTMCDDDAKQLRRLNDDLVLMKMFHQASPKAPNPMATKAWEEYQQLRTKALNTETAGTGLEFMPDEMSSDLIEQYLSDRRVAGLFDQLTMPNDPYTWPVSKQMGLPYLIGENTSDTGEKIPVRDPGTDDVTFTTKTVGMRVIWSRNLDERSMVNMSAWTNRQISLGLADGLETMVLNGDTAATHMDTVVTAANDCRHAMNGLRKLALSPSTDTVMDCATFTQANIAKLRNMMGKYAGRPSELVQIVSLGVANLMMQNVSDAFSAFATMDKVGPNAVNVTGEIGQLYGAPVITSDLLPETCSNSWLNDGLGSDGLFVVANRTCFGLGSFGGILVEVVYDAETQQFKLIGSMQRAFMPYHDATTETAVAVGYNISVA
jgi:HK97 family phage major capsid protein